MELAWSGGSEVPRVGLVLGGGGVAGFAYHAAALAALQQRTGWDPRLARVIVGTSAGSGVASLLRGGVPVGAVLERQLTIPTNPRAMAHLRELTGRDVRPEIPLRKPRPRWWLVPSSPAMVAREVWRGPRLRPVRISTGLMPDGRVATYALGERSRELHGDGWPDQALWLTAVRLGDGARVVFGRDPVITDVGSAVEASSAIPAFFQPVVIDGERYVDGGVHSCSNADLLAGEDLDLVVVVSPMSASLRLTASTVTGPMRAYCRMVLDREVAAIRRSGIRVLVLEPSLEEVRTMGTNLLDPGRTVFIVLQTAQWTAARLDRPDIAEEIDMLSQAALDMVPPADVAYPE
jgi:NTE family protein